MFRLNVYEEHMKNRILFLLTVLLVAVMMTSTVSAGGNVGLTRLAFKPSTSDGTTTLALAASSENPVVLDSLSATAKLTGLGGYRQGVIANLAASGDPVVSCTNQGGNMAPGQNPSKVNAAGDQFVGPQNISKKGTAPMNVTAEPEPLTAIEGGCPSENWTARIVSVSWTNAAITIIDKATGDILFDQIYVCDPKKQTNDQVICTETN